MESKNLFRRYQKRLILEAVIKSLILGFCIGLLASIAPAIICIIYNASGLLYCLAVMLGVGAAATAVFYFVMFKPSQKQVANRIDRLGLEERAVTMMEFEKNESYMAKLQREDAQTRIQAASAKKIRFRIFKAPIIILAVIAVCAIGLTTFSMLSVEPPIEYTPPIVGEPEPEKGIEFVTVRYEAYEHTGGDVNDFYLQTIIKGGDAKTVVAVPWPGYMFLTWMTENGEFLEEIERTDRKVQKDLLVYAVFLPEYEADPNQNSSTEENQHVKHINTIKDGNIYYGDDFALYYDKVKEMLIDSGSDISTEQRNIIELYFDTLRKQK